MAAATAAREDKRSEGRLKSCPVAAVAVYKGTLVGRNSAGYLASMAHGTASMKFEGVCLDTKDNSAGAAGDVSARVWVDGEYEFVYNGGDAAQAIVGKMCYAVDNQTVDEDPATVTNEYPIGTIVEIVSATKVRVRIEPPVPRQGAQAAIVSLTDSSGGTANDTVQAIGGTYSQSEVANNFADVTAKINAILVALRAAGIVAQ